MKGFIDVSFGCLNVGMKQMDERTSKNVVWWFGLIESIENKWIVKMVYE